MLDLNQLKNLLDTEFAGVDAADVIDVLNAQNIEYYIQPATADFTNYLYNSGLYAKLLAVYRDHANLAVRVAAESALDLAASQIAQVNINNANTRQMLEVLVQAGVWTQQEADGVISFARRFRSRANELWGVDVTEIEIHRARLLDKVAQQQAVIASTRTALAMQEHALAMLESGVDVEVSNV